MSSPQPTGAIGPLVVSLLARTPAQFREALERGAAADADIVEFRLDHVARGVLDGSVTREALAELFAAADRPTIAAIHGQEGFGTFRGSVAQRSRVLVAASNAGASFLDIDASFMAAASLDSVPTPRILSTHRDVDAMDAGALDEIAAELDALVRPGSGDLIKIIPEAERAEDVLVLLDWLSERPAGSTIAFASGQPASFSRIAATAFGSVLVYAAPAAIDEPDPKSPLLSSAAPGQLRVPHVRAAWGGEGRVPSKDTRLAAVCGRPIGHSASPVTHAAAFRTLGFDALFLPIAPTSFEAFARVVRDDPRWVGLSVTAPFKIDAIELSAGEEGGGACGAAAAMGAANTLCFESKDASGRRFRAANTDAPAVGMAIAAGLGREEFKGLTSVVIGAGGAARAATHALLERGSCVVVAARRPSEAQSLADKTRCPDSQGLTAVDLESDDYRALRPDIIVHTTPLGTDGIGEPQVPDEHLRPGVVVLDAVYRPRETGLLRRAAALGAIPVSGERWFLLQAWLQHVALFFELYRELQVEVDAGSAEKAMGEALQLWLSGQTSSHKP